MLEYKTILETLAYAVLPCGKLFREDGTGVILRAG